MYIYLVLGHHHSAPAARDGQCGEDVPHGPYIYIYIFIYLYLYLYLYLYISICMYIYLVLRHYHGTPASRNGECGDDVSDGPYVCMYVYYIYIYIYIYIYG